MTDDQRRLIRIQVWERYETAKNELASQRSRVTGWNCALKNVSLFIESESLERIAEEWAKLPERRELVAAVEELITAKEAFSKVTQEARALGFPV
jgi:hypothetical protein